MSKQPTCGILPSVKLNISVVSLLCLSCFSAAAQVAVQQFTRSVNAGVRGVTSCTPAVQSISEDQISPTLPVNATNHTLSVSESSGGLHEAFCHGDLESAEIRSDLFQATGTITSSATGTNFVCGAADGPSGLGDVSYRAQFTCPTPVRYRLTVNLTRSISGTTLSGSGAGSRVRLFHHNSTNTFLANVTAGTTGTNFTQTGLLIPQPGYYEIYAEANSSAVATNPSGTATGGFGFELEFATCDLTCPPTQYAVEDGNSGAAIVTFPDPVGDAGCEFVSVVCDPPSGSSFPVGTTTVNCVATDAFANESTCAFDVVVWQQAADDDGDGVTNGDELAAGTDPFSAVSAFRIIEIARQTDDIRVTWETGIGKTNALQRSAIVSGGYSDIFTVTNTTGSVTNYVDPSAGTNSPSLFYRVRIVPAGP